MSCSYGLVGAGGFGREVMPLLQQSIGGGGGANTCFIVEGAKDAPRIRGTRVLDVPEFCRQEGARYFNVAIGDSAVRERIATTLASQGCVAKSIVAGNAVVMEGSEIGEGAILCPFTTVTTDATIGRFFHANLYSYVAHDCVIGDFVTFAPAVKCNGNVVVESHAYIGTGAIIRPGSSGRPLVIGRGAIVGMGAVVTRDVAPGETVVGNPAKVMVRHG